MVIKPDGPGTLSVRFADRHVDIGNQIGPDARRRRLLLAHGIESPFACDCGHGATGARDVEGSALGFVIRTGDGAHRFEAEIEPRKLHTLAWPQEFDVLRCPCRHACDAGHR